MINNTLMALILCTAPSLNVEDRRYESIYVGPMTFNEMMVLSQRRLPTPLGFPNTNSPLSRALGIDDIGQ